MIFALGMINEWLMNCIPDSSMKPSKVLHEFVESHFSPDSIHARIRYNFLRFSDTAFSITIIISHVLKIKNASFRTLNRRISINSDNSDNKHNYPELFVEPHTRLPA